MDVLLVIVGAVLLAIGSRSGDDVKGIIKGIGFVLIAIGSIWFLVSFVQSCTLASQGYGYY